MTPDKWDERFLDLAQLVGGWSKDPGTKVGAVIVRLDRTVVSLGYNGFPRGVDDTYQDREHKLLRTVHAEMNAILSARGPLHGCTLYVTPLCPCSNCAASIIQSGIGRVVARTPREMRPEWRASLEAGHEMFEQAMIDVDIYFAE